MLGTHGPGTCRSMAVTMHSMSAQLPTHFAQVSTSLEMVIANVFV